MYTIGTCADDRRALADVRTRLARCGAIQVVVRAFSAVQEDMKGLEKPPPRHPLPVVQQGCRFKYIDTLIP
jgi:hypothetical protein